MCALLLVLQARNYIQNIQKYETIFLIGNVTVNIQLYQQIDSINYNFVTFLYLQRN